MPPHDHHHDRGGAPPPPPPPKSNEKLLSMILKLIIMTSITTLFFLFLGVAAILLLLATAALHRHSDHHHQSSSSSNGLSLKDLKRLPQFRFSRKSEAVIGDCAVCLEGFKPGQWCRKLTVCGHVFHRKCIDTWFVKVSACPICRSRVRLGSLIKDRPLWGFRYIVSS